MSDIPSAKVSPRIENGVLKWYEGDTFEVQIELELEDQDGDEVTIGTSDTIEVVFEDESGKTVKTFELSEIENNMVTLEFDATATALFTRGKYTYYLHHTGERRTTLLNRNMALVE